MINVEVHRQEEDQRVVMSKRSTGHACNACAKVFNAAIDLERHMNDKHFQGKCQMFETEFTTKKQADEHICTEPEILTQKCNKSYCQKEFATSQALRVHIKKSHFSHQRTVCTKCDEILKTQDVRNHMDMCGKSIVSIERTQERSMEVCRHWRRGRCDRGSRCNFSHVGHQDAPRQERQSTKSASTVCRNGPSCVFLARGSCMFKHNEDKEHQTSRPSQERRQVAPRAQCKWGGDCTKVPNCPHLHSVQDFPQYSRNQGFRATKRGNNNRQLRY